MVEQRLRHLMFIGVIARVDESSKRVSYSGTSTTGSYTIGDLGGNTTVSNRGISGQCCG